MGNPLKLREYTLVCFKENRHKCDLLFIYFSLDS